MMYDEKKVLSVVLDQTASLVWKTDTALEIMEVRGTTLRMAGIDVTQMVERISGAHQRALQGATTDLHYESGERVYEVHIAPLIGEGSVIAGCLGVARDATARFQAERTMAWQAGHDPLTALPNRAQLREVLSARIREARRSGGALALLIIDIDALHAINDAAGSDAGDAVLCSVARRIESAVAKGCGHVARTGDDEFTVIVDQWPVRTAAAIAASMTRPFEIGTSEALVTVSVGIAELSRHGDSADQLLRAAGAAVRRAKDLGGNQYQFSSADLTIAAAERLGTERDLRGAIERGELCLAFQPQVRLHDRALLGVEALLRWERDGQLLAAASFIRVLEQSPLIIDVGEWVLNEACRQLREWRDEGIAPPRLAINVGARHFQHPGFLSTVRRAIERYGIDGRMLEIEITETTAMHNAESSAQLIDDLRELGVEITVDDFGTGYSSLAYLNRFAITGVKIDQSFVHDLPSRSASAIVNAILATAHALGLRVVAEGVEDPRQAGLLEAAGCLEAQGYWFARPMSAEKLSAYLRDLGRWDANGNLDPGYVPW